MIPLQPFLFEKTDGMKWPEHYVFGLFGNLFINFNLSVFSREHLQEVISLLSNESKSSSLPLNENKEEEEEQEETTFPDIVK